VLQSEPARTDEHFTKIIIHAETRDGSLFDLVKDHTILKKIILDGCPCRLSEESHNFSEINDFCNGLNILPCRVLFQGVEMMKSVPVSVGPLQRKKIETRIGKQDVVLAEAWYCTNKNNKLIESPFAGIRIFRDGIPIGLPNLYNGKEYPDSEITVTRPDLLNWHIGEVHILHEELRPDASGEGLRASELFRIFREELRKFYSDFSVVLF